MKTGLTALICICIIVGASALKGWSHLKWTAPPLKEAPALPVVSDAEISPRPPRLRLPNIASRNLFHPDRRPVAATKSAAASTSPAGSSDFVLNGTAQVGGVTCAWIEVQGRRGVASKHGAYRVGQLVAETGFAVERIDARAVILKNGRQTLTLKLNERH